MASSVGSLTVIAGISIAALASGFGVCLFNLDSVGECLAVAHSWVDVFKKAGVQIINWFFAILNGAASSAPPPQ